MKKRISVSVICALVCFFALAGCGLGIDADVSTIALQKSGKITETSIEDFSASYYDEDELSSYIEEAVSEYTEENGKNSVKVSAQKVEEDTACLVVTYADAATYADFSGEECFAGDILEAQTEGYDFSGIEFCQVEDGSALEDTADGSEVLETDELNVFIVRTNEAVQVPGDIVYVSADQTEVTSSDTVTVVMDEEAEDETVLVYVIYE